MRKTLIAGLVALAAYTGYGQAKATVTGTQIVVQDQKPIRRVELVATGFPANVDAFFLWEKQEKPFSKFRLQTLPVSYGHFSAGVSEQWVTTGKPYDELGAVARVSGKLDSAGSFAKCDLRYFPKTNILDWYGFVSTRDFFADVLGAYNAKTKIFFFRPGVDYKMSQNIALGIEAKISGNVREPKTNYVGARLKAAF